MTWESVQDDQGGISRTALIGGSVAAVIALAVGALLLANTFIARQIVDDATVLERSERALGANEISVMALSQALLLKEDQALEVADQETVDRAVAEAHRRVTELENATSSLAEVVEPGAGLADSSAAALRVADDVLTAITLGETSRASEALTGGLVHFEQLRDDLLEIRDASQGRIDASGGLAGQSGSTVAFLVALLVPLLAILGYRWLAQNQVRVAEVELSAQLEAEQAIMRAKDEFIANVSHELRTPLTSIFGLSELLLEQGLVDQESSTDLLQVIYTEAVELTRMVEDILVLARVDAGNLTYQFEDVDIAKKVEEFVEDFVGIEGVVVDAPKARAWVDPMRLRHILRNLLSNAHRHGGPRIEVTIGQDDSTVTLVVADDGEGVSEHDRGRLFQSYFHEGDAPLTEGTLGMGLAAVGALARGMHGVARYERVGDWTRFSVTLPKKPVEPQLESRISPAA